MWVERQQETVPPLLQHLSPFDPDSDGVGAGQRRRRLLVLCPRFARAARAMAAAKKMSGQSTRPRRRGGRRGRPSAGRFDPATLTPSAHRLSVRNNATIAYADCRRGRRQRRRWRSCCEPLPSHRPLIRCKQRTKAARRFASVDRLFSRGAI